MPDTKRIKCRTCAQTKNRPSFTESEQKKGFSNKPARCKSCERRLKRGESVGGPKRRKKKK